MGAPDFLSIFAMHDCWGRTQLSQALRNRLAVKK